MCYIVPGLETCYNDFDVAQAAAIARKSYVLEPRWCTHGKDLTTQAKNIAARGDRI